MKQHTFLSITLVAAGLALVGCGKKNEGRGGFGGGAPGEGFTYQRELTTNPRLALPSRGEVGRQYCAAISKPACPAGDARYQKVLDYTGATTRIFEPHYLSLNSPYPILGDHCEGEKLPEDATMKVSQKASSGCYFTGKGTSAFLMPPPIMGRSYVEIAAKPDRVGELGIVSFQSHGTWIGTGVRDDNQSWMVSKTIVQTQELGEFSICTENHIGDVFTQHYVVDAGSCMIEKSYSGADTP